MKLNKEEIKLIVEQLNNISESFSENITGTAYTTISGYKYIIK